MGTIYTVGCRDCKVTRDLDKFYHLRVIHDRQEALELGKELEQLGAAFRAGLLASFLWEHKGHNCTVFSEHDENIAAEFDMDVDDSRFWYGSAEEYEHRDE